MKNVFYFTADWCGPCKKVRPVVEELIKDGYSFQIIDADTELELVKTFEIRSIPTFILFDNKVEVSRISGAKTRKDLEKFING
jgi:thioredoxin-like negative regulator of GroEL